MGVKILISALPNMGKTTLLEPLEEVLVISRDGKAYPFPQPHKNVPDFKTVDELILIITNTIKAYKAANKDERAKTIVFDSISKILLDIEAETLLRVSSFPYGVINIEIKKLMDFIERRLVPNYNIVFVSHAIHDADADGFNLVNAGGSWGKKGGVISEVDHAVFLDMKGKKRIVTLRDPAKLSRTLGLKDLPNSMPAADFNLQDHITKLEASLDTASRWSL